MFFYLPYMIYVVIRSGESSLGEPLGAYSDIGEALAFCCRWLGIESPQDFVYDGDEDIAVFGVPIDEPLTYGTHWQSVLSFGEDGYVSAA